MPIPYLWGKTKSARHIYNVINAHTKNRKQDILLDLFTWGFAISEEFVKKWWKTINNDKNKYVMWLLQKSLEWLPSEVYNWISRENFEKILKNPEKYEDWYVGFVQCVWTFWNNQKGYLYWKDIEKLKEISENFVVNKVQNSIIEEIIWKRYIAKILMLKDIHARRKAFSRVMKTQFKNGKQKEKRLINMQRLQNLERLEWLEWLEHKENILSITSLSYDEVTIPDDVIVYCDPPYRWTAEYAEWNFNHDKFWEYIRKISKTHSVFVSEYSAPSDFRAIYEFPQKSSLQWWTQKHNKQPTEKIFVYNFK